MWTAKVPVLLLYDRLFGVRKWMRFSCFTTLVMTGLVILVGDAYNAAMCMPRQTLDLQYIGNCNTVSSTVGIVCGFVGIFADAVIFILPLPVIANLHVPLSRKIALAVAFLFGILYAHTSADLLPPTSRLPNVSLTVGSSAIVASSVSLNFKWKSLSGTPTDIILAMTLT